MPLKNILSLHSHRVWFVLVCYHCYVLKNIFYQNYFDTNKIALVIFTVYIREKMTLGCLSIGIFFIHSFIIHTIIILQVMVYDESRSDRRQMQSQSLILDLKAGDKVWLKSYSSSAYAVYSNLGNYITFNGYLLQAS